MHQQSTPRLISESLCQMQAQSATDLYRQCDEYAKIQQMARSFPAQGLFCFVATSLL
jgi:hypothetical protein